MHNRIVHAPLTDPETLIDVGCGTGFVTRDLGTQYPSAIVYGIDISPVPKHKAEPSNVSFLQGDIRALKKTDDRLRPGTVDLIFQRLLIVGITDWPGYIKDMAELLSPGGWLEVHDYAYIWFKGGQICSRDWKWLQAMRRGADQLGLDLDCGLNAKRYMDLVGLVDVQVFKYTVPSGTWLADRMPETRLIGEHQAEEIASLFTKHMIPGVTRGLGLSEQEINELKEDCFKTLAAEEGKYFHFYVTIGKKG